MTMPSDAAKAASLLHHTWGVPDAKAAVGLYDMLNIASEDEFKRLLDHAEGWGIYEAFENLSVALLWENIRFLAESIDSCREELK